MHEHERELLSWEAMLRMDADALRQFAAEHFPQITGDWWSLELVEESGVTLRQHVNERSLRPGGTVSGPTLMALADLAMYFLVLSRIGPVPLAVTTNLNINFLRRPALADVRARAEMLKLGRRLAVGQITMCSIGDAAPIAHATSTYSIPPLP